MPCQLKNRYSLGERCVLRWLRLGFARPAALLLIGVFLLANLLFAYAEMRGDATSPEAAGSSFCHLDIQFDLNSATVEGREFGGGREVSESFSHLKSEFASSSQKRKLARLLGGNGPARTIVSTNLYLPLFCNTPFSPRPPPFSTMQG